MVKFSRGDEVVEVGERYVLCGHNFVWVGVVWDVFLAEYYVVEFVFCEVVAAVGVIEDSGADVQVIEAQIFLVDSQLEGRSANCCSFDAFIIRLIQFCFHMSWVAAAGIRPHFGKSYLLRRPLL